MLIRFARIAVAVAGLYILALCPVVAQDSAVERRVVRLVQQHCLKCHSATVTNAGLDLSDFKGDLDVWRRRSAFTKVLDMLRRNLMPPEEEPELRDSNRALITDWLEHTLEHVDIERIPRDPGFVPPRRLTRAEYNYTVQDLFGIDVEPARVFPPDQTIADGFDNDASTLTVEPLWFEKALGAAEETIRAVWANSEALDRLLVTRPSPPPIEEQALYAATEELSRATDLGDGDFTILARIQGDSGNIFTKTTPGSGFGRGSKELVWTQDALVYRIRRGRELRAEGIQIADGEPHWVALSLRNDRATLYLDGRLLASRAEFSRPDFDGHLLKIGVGERTRREEGEDPVEPKLVYPGIKGFWFFASALPADIVTATALDPLGASLPNPVFRWVPGVEPPTPSGFITAEDAGARVLGQFLEKAFRRPPAEDELSRYTGLFRRGVDSGMPFDLAIQLPVAAALASPSFLFRSETAVEGPGLHPVSSVDMASRLSYFLWSSAPDEELLSAGKDGRLADPGELLRQTDRMLADGKANRFFERFVYQWLRTDGLGDTVKPDEDRFPEVDASLMASMRQEGALVFGDLVRGNRPLLRLLDDEFTFMNQDLAAHYGYENVKGSAWRKVPLLDSSRGGLLTQAAVLTVSSSPRRTSPVFRGKWVLEVLLGEPPPPPPPNVPDLPATAEKSGASLRDLLEAHRREAVCAGCHSRIDPYGLALEQYDAVGRLRKDAQDTTATLFNGERLDGAAELKRYLIEQKGPSFVRHLLKRMLVYALGRELKFPDERPVQLIFRRLENDGYGAATLIREIVLSEPFRYRMNPRMAETAKAGSDLP